MSLVLVVFLVVLLVPLATATWRMSLLGLALQGALLAWIAASHFVGLPPDALLAVADLGVLRGLVAPIILYRVLSRLGTPRRVEAIPANLLSWSLAAGLVLVAFRFAQLPGLTQGALGSTHLAVATAALLLGFFILASRREALSQIVGLLRIENAIALFELGSSHEPSAPLRLGLGAVYLATVLTFAGFLLRFGERHDPARAHDEVML